MIRTLILAAGIAVAAVSAQAATMQAVYTSVITYAEVYRGGNGLSAGDTVTTTFIYDTNAIGIRNTGPTSDYLNSPTAIQSVTVAYNGWSYSFVGNGYGFLGVNNNFGTMQYLGEVLGTKSDGTGFHNIGFSNGFGSYAVNPPRLDAPATAVADFNGYFYMDMNIFIAATGEIHQAYVEGLSQSVTISTVPVPATFPLMLAGFGGLVALRRRQKAA